MMEIAQEIEIVGGVFRCVNCGHEQSAIKTRSQWPEHCGQSMTFISQSQIDYEKTKASVEPKRKSRKHNPYHDSTYENMEKVYQFVKQFVKKNGYAPSLEQMAEGIGWPAAYSSNVSQLLIPPLIAAGFLERKGKGARMIYPVENPPRPHFYKRGKAK